MKAIFVTLFLCVLNCTYATNYYFSSQSGNDNRSNSEAQNPSTPWKTLDKLNSIFSSLKPGDNIFLKRGETFNGSIVVKQSGSASSPITIGAYGSGNRPVITSLVSLSGWASKGGNIWESSTSLNSTVNMVIVNGVEQEMGRYPNSDASNKGYLNFESHYGKTSITDNQLNTSINWKGAELVTRPRHWILNRSLITAESGHKISYTTNSPYEPFENYGYFIQNSIKALDKFGEWYYNSSTKKLSIYFGSKGPSSYNVQAATTTNDLISSSNYSNIVFDNLTVKGSNGSGFFINNGSNIHIQNCDILFSGITGALVHGHNNLHVENCSISNSNNNGIDMEYGVTNAVIKNNKIVNTALIAGLLQNGEGQGLAIYSNGDGATIANNELRATGFIGMTFYGTNVNITNNFIDSFCFVKDDGGGIYSHGGSKSTTNRKLSGNVILNGMGAGEGTDRPTKVSTSGVYIDNNTTNIEISDNTVTKCFQGIFIQSTTGMTVKNNTVFDNNRQMTVIQRAGDNSSRNTTMTGNNFFSKSKDEYSLYVMSSGNDISSFGTFDNNYYARPIDDNLTIFSSPMVSGKASNQDMNLAGWQKKYGKDAHSKKSPKTITNTNDIRFEYNSSSVSKSVSLNGNNYVDVMGKNYSGNLSLQPYTSAVLIRTSGSGSVNDAPTIDITSPGTGIGFTAPASINITASAADDDGSVAKVEFYNGKTLLGTDNSSPYSYTWNNIAAGDYTLTAKATDNKGLATTSSPITVSVTKQVSGAPSVSLTSPSNNATFNAPASISFTASASDNNGSVTRVDFYNGNNLLGTDYSSPYTFTWNNVGAGNYSLTAKATDNSGLSTSSSPVSVSVSSKGGLISPVVSITSPVSNSTYAPSATITLTALASDADGSVKTVEFFNGSTLLNIQTTSPYTYLWKNVPAGSYSITAKATDNDGLVTVSSPAFVTVGTGGGKQAPTVAIVIPASDTTLRAGIDFTLFAVANDADGSIKKVEYFNGSKLLKTEYTSPYTYKWQNIPAGNYTIKAKATDDDGNVTTSAPVIISANKDASKSSSQTTIAVSAAAIEPASISAPGTIADSHVEKGALLSEADLSRLTNFRLFPNPAISTIQLYFDGLQATTYKKADLTIHNALGAVLKTYPVVISGKKINVDISSLSSGIYFIDLNGDNFKISKKFVKIN